MINIKMIYYGIVFVVIAFIVYVFHFEPLHDLKKKLENEKKQALLEKKQKDKIIEKMKFEKIKDFEDRYEKEKIIKGKNDEADINDAIGSHIIIVH